ncbi:MAG TPA: ribbon-helix-helix protein, CopG family [Terriglobia bacterium]|nr:ribbon-helix-helix protein, CopG family [Terriglobia bacterium]
METIQVVLDSKLLGAVAAAAKRARVNRSALVRGALREHLKRLETQSREARDRRGYEQHPDDASEVAGWEGAVVWPERNG